MAEETRAQDVEPEGTVTLVSPSGGEYRTHSPVEINNLVYGQGYRIKDSDEPAADASAEDVEPAQSKAADTAAGTEAPQAGTEAPAAPAAAPSKASAKATAKTGPTSSPTAVNPPSTT